MVGILSGLDHFLCFAIRPTRNKNYAYGILQYVNDFECKPFRIYRVKKTNQFYTLLNSTIAMG